MNLDLQSLSQIAAVSLTVLVFTTITTYILPRITIWWMETELFSLRSKLYRIAIETPELLNSPYYKLVEADLCLKISLVRNKPSLAKWRYRYLSLLNFGSDESGSSTREVPDGYFELSPEEYCHKLFPSGGWDRAPEIREVYKKTETPLQFSLLWGDTRFGTVVWGITLLFIFPIIMYGFYKFFVGFFGALIDIHKAQNAEIVGQVAHDVISVEKFAQRVQLQVA